MTTSVPRRSRLHDATQATRPDHPGERRLVREQGDAGARIAGLAGRRARKVEAVHLGRACLTRAAVGYAARSGRPPQIDRG